jgi:RNA polymerase sigma-70 factor (ECF subfamily)
VHEQRSVPWTSRRPAGRASHFQDRDGSYPGHWRSAPAAWPTPEGTALIVEIQAVIADALDELPPRQRAVISMRDIADHTAPSRTGTLADISLVRRTLPTRPIIPLHTHRSTTGQHSALRYSVRIR